MRVVDLDEEDWPDDEDDGSSDVMPCPSCGSDVYDDAEQCPACGMYIVASRSAWAGQPRWWTVLGLVGIGAVILALIG